MKALRWFLCALAAMILLAVLAGCGAQDGETGKAAEQPAPTEIPIPEGDYVNIQVDGETVARIPLSDAPKTVTLRGKDGEVNIVRVTENGAVMESANCQGQDCVQAGAVTLDNWEIRPWGAFIYCLPHRVTVELVVRE